MQRAGARCVRVTWLAAGAALAALLGLSACSRDDDPSTAGQLTQGRVLMSRYHCGSCHAIPGVPAAQAQVAIRLDAFGRRSYIAGHVPNTEDHLVRWLIDPQAMVPGTTMPQAWCR